MVALVVEVAFEVSVKLVDEVNHVDYNDAHWLYTIIKYQWKLRLKLSGLTICINVNVKMNLTRRNLPLNQKMMILVNMLIEES